MNEAKDEGGGHRPHFDNRQRLHRPDLQRQSERRGRTPACHAGGCLRRDRDHGQRRTGRGRRHRGADAEERQTRKALKKVLFPPFLGTVIAAVALTFPTQV